MMAMGNKISKQNTNFYALNDNLLCDYIDVSFIHHIIIIITVIIHRYIQYYLFKPIVNLGRMDRNI